MARVQESLQDTNEAIKYFAQAFAHFVRLVQDHPDDLSYRSLLTTTLIRSAALAFSQGKSQVAIEQLATAQTQVSEVLKLDPDHAEALSMLEALPKFREQIRVALEEAAASRAETGGDANETSPKVPM